MKHTRRRKGIAEYRLICSRCGTVRWLPMTAVGIPHCHAGSFAFSTEYVRAVRAEHRRVRQFAADLEPRP
jgi:hypothetical protein